jgi:hypothetical protein
MKTIAIQRQIKRNRRSDCVISTINYSQYPDVHASGAAINKKMTGNAVIAAKSRRDQLQRDGRKLKMLCGITMKANTTACRALSSTHKGQCFAEGICILQCLAAPAQIDWQPQR